MASSIRWGLLTAWLAVLMFMEWQPFDFAFDLSQAASRLRNVTLLPFLDYYGGDYLATLDDFVHKLLLFVPLGAALAPPPPAQAGSRAGLFRWLAAIAAAIVLELGQLFLPTRYASLTDVLVASAGLAGPSPHLPTAERLANGKRRALSDRYVPSLNFAYK